MKIVFGDGWRTSTQTYYKNIVQEGKKNMAEELKTYYDFADNNYDFLMAAYKNGLVGNAMGAMAQETCEKYLKHLIDEYVILGDSADNAKKTEILRTHNLTKLSKYISSHLPEVKFGPTIIKLGKWAVFHNKISW